MGKREEIGFFSREVCIFSPRGTSQEVRKTFFPRAKWNFARGKKVFLTKCEVPRGEKIHTSREKKPTFPRAKWNFARGKVEISSRFPIGKSYSYIFSICAKIAKNCKKVFIYRIGEKNFSYILEVRKRNFSPIRTIENI